MIPNNKIHIREAGASDAADVARLVKELAVEDGFESPIDESFAHNYLAHPNNRALLAEKDGRCVGLLSYLLRNDLYHAGETGYITELVVSRDYRGQGIGSRLLEELLHRLETRGTIEVSVTTMPDNERAIRFYKRHGLVDEAIFLEKHLR